VVAIGTRLDELSTHGWDNKVLLTNKLIHVDCNPEHFYQSPMAALHVFGSPHLVFSKVYEGLNEHALPNSPTLRQATSLSEFKHNPALSEVVKHKGHLRVIESARPTPTADQLAFSARNFTLNDEEKCFSEASPIKPQRLMFELSRLFPPSTRYVADIGNAFLWAIHYLQPKDRRIGGTRSATAGMLRIGMGYSSMGWGIGGAIGTAFGCPDCPIVTVVGDGSLLMNGQEITVALEHHLNVIFVVLNDAAYGTVKHGQAMAKAEPIGYELPKVDFKLFAEAMGIPAYTIHSPSDLLKLDINALCRRGGPTLLDVHIDGDEIPPLASRIKVLGWDLEKEVKQ